MAFVAGVDVDPHGSSSPCSSAMRLSSVISSSIFSVW